MQEMADDRQREPESELRDVLGRLVLCGGKRMLGLGQECLARQIHRIAWAQVRAVIRERGHQNHAKE